MTININQPAGGREKIIIKTESFHLQTERKKITNFEKNKKMGKIGPTELLIFIVIPIIILFFIFKAGQWYGQSKKEKKN